MREATLYRLQLRFNEGNTEDFITCSGKKFFRLHRNKFISVKTLKRIFKVLPLDAETVLETNYENEEHSAEPQTPTAHAVTYSEGGVDEIAHNLFAPETRFRITLTVEKGTYYFKILKQEELECFEKMSERICA